MPWTWKRLVALVGVAASMAGIVLFVEELYPGVEIVHRISLGFDWLGRLVGLVPPYQVGPIPLGHIILGVLAFTLFILLFYRPLTRGEKEEDRTRAEQARSQAEQRRFRAEQRTFAANVLESLQGGTGAAGTEEQKVSAEVVTFSDAEIVNAPMEKVWDFLNETDWGPTYEGLLEEIQVTARDGDFVSWEGNGRIANKEISVEGTTRRAAPTKLEVACSSGALKGFECTYEVEERGAQTKVTEEATFDPREIPEEFSALADGLSLLVRHTLSRDLRRLKERVEQQPASPSHPSADTTKV